MFDLNNSSFSVTGVKWPTDFYSRYLSALNYLQAHESMRRIQQHRMLQSCASMRAMDSLGQPVCPVNKVFKYADRKRMRYVQLCQLDTVLSIPIT